MKIRIISALVALAIVIPLIWVGGIPFAIGAGIISILGYKEILDLKKSHSDIPFLVKVLGLFSVIYLVLGDYNLSSVNVVMSYPKLIIPIFLLLIPTVFYKKDRYTTKDAFYLLGATYFVGLFFSLLISIRNINLNLLIYLIAVCIFTDMFAFLIGVLIGKHKISKISPKKSWEGAIAGLVGGSIVGLIVYYNLVDSISFITVLVTILLSIGGQVGDFVYSKIKRENSIKDFSNIMPGHGGILDRIDSLSFVIFIYVVLLYLF